MSISNRARCAAPSPTLAIAARVHALRAEGVDVIDFSAGEPDCDTQEPIPQAAVDAPAGGDTELKDAILAKLARDNGLTYRRDNRLVSCGAKQSLYNLFQTLLDPGDEVVLPAPYRAFYPEQIKLAGGVPVFVPTLPENDFMPTHTDIRKALSSRTRAIVLNSPSDPSGGVASRQTVKELAALCMQYSLFLISDESYEKLLYDGRRHLSPAALGEKAFQRTVLINGCSQACAMPDWRIGYAASADTELLAAMGRLQDHSASSPTSRAQKAAVAALNGSQEPVEALRQGLEVRRNQQVDGLNALPGVTCRLPGGAFYAFPDLSGLLGKRCGDRLIHGSDDLAAYLLEEARVAVVPGSGFGANRHLRLCYATSAGKIAQGLERMKAALNKLE